MPLLFAWLCCIAASLAGTAAAPSSAALTWPPPGGSGAVAPGDLVFVEILGRPPAAGADAAPGNAGEADDEARRESVRTDRAGSMAGGERRPDETLVARFLSRDGQHRDTTGWRPDMDPRPGFVAFTVPELWLAPGRYRARVHRGSTVEELALPPAPHAPGQVSLTLPTGATGVRALRHTEGRGHDGWAFAPAVDGRATLPLGSGRWTATATGPPGDRTAQLELTAGSHAASFQTAVAQGPRATRSGHRLLVALGLAPVSLLLLAAATLGAWRARRTRGLGLALLCGIILATVALARVLPHPTETLLVAGPGLNDPPNSAALLDAIADSILRLSDVSDRFLYPEGHSWLVVGPSWLLYLLALPATWLGGGILGHNAGVFIGVVLLFTLAWGLARQAGAGAVPALAAGAGAVLAPCIWRELATLSLDRATLFTAPLFILLLERAAADEGRRWAVAAGLALAAAFYGQVYYGIYLALACPLLVLSRLVGPAPGRRLGQMLLVAAVALAALIPGAVALRQGTADTVYATPGGGLRAQITAEGRDWLHPFAPGEAQAFVAAHDPRMGGDAVRPEATPKDRLLMAVTNATPVEELLVPASTLTGRAAWWPLALLSLLVLPRRRRGPALRLFLDALILLVFSLGPVALRRDGSVGGLLPYYAASIAIPGADQLKHPERFALLAATLSSVPLSLGIDGLLRRLRLHRPDTAARAGRMLLVTVVTLPLVALSLPPATRFSRRAALAALDPGPALFLPAVTPPTEAQYMQAIEADLPMVNDAPYGQTRGGGTVSWIEANPLLNRAAWLAGSDRLRRILEPGGGERARADLVAQGLRYIVLTRDSLAGPELAQGLETWMDAHFQRVAEDPQTVVWGVATAGDAPTPGDGATVAP